MTYLQIAVKLAFLEARPKPMRNLLSIAALGLAASCTDTEPGNPPQTETSPAVQSIMPTADGPDASAHVSISQNQYAQAVSVASSLFTETELRRQNDYPGMAPMWGALKTYGDYDLTVNLTGGESPNMRVYLDGSFGGLTFETRLASDGCSFSTYFDTPNHDDGQGLTSVVFHSRAQDVLESPLYLAMCEEMVKKIGLQVRQPEPLAESNFNSLFTSYPAKSIATN